MVNPAHTFSTLDSPTASTSTSTTTAWKLQPLEANPRFRHLRIATDKDTAAAMGGTAAFPSSDPSMVVVVDGAGGLSAADEVDASVVVVENPLQVQAAASMDMNRIKAFSTTTTSSKRDSLDVGEVGDDDDDDKEDNEDEDDLDGGDHSGGEEEEDDGGEEKAKDD